MSSAATAYDCETDASVVARPHRRSFRGYGTMIAMAVLLVAFHAPLLRYVYAYLVVDEAIAPCDLAVLSDGDPRLWAAAGKLYRGGFVKGIVVMNNTDRPTIRAGIQPSLMELVKPALTRIGVPEDAIFDVTVHANTLFENIGETDQWLRPRADKIVYLAAAHRSRYCRDAIDTVLEERGDAYTIYAVDNARFDTGQWWKSRRGLTSVFGSYVSLFSIWNGDMSRAKSAEWDPDSYLDSLLADE